MSVVSKTFKQEHPGSALMKVTHLGGCFNMSLVAQSVVYLTIKLT